jgi:hypothetical protein
LNVAELEECGFHEKVFNAIMKCDADIRDELFSNIVLAGGPTKTKGLYYRALPVSSRFGYPFSECPELCPTSL